MNPMKSITLAVLMATSFAAQAGFEIVDESMVKPMPPRKEKAAEPAKAKGALPSIVYLNEPSGNPKQLKGMGSEVPLADAIRVIIPFKDWHVYNPRGMDVSQPVSWKGNRPWPEVLSTVMVQSGKIAQIDWTAKKVIVLDAQTAEDRSPVKAAKNDQAAEGEDPVIVKKVVKPAPKAPDWEASPKDGTIRNVIDKWARVAGWQMYWYPESDFEISAYVKMTGTFEEALQRLAKSASLEITMYRGNKVVVVKERS